MLWPFEETPAAIERNRKDWAGVDQAYATLLSVVNEQRRSWNLSEYTNLLEDSFSPLAQICQQPPIFEFPRPQAPVTLHLVGHLQDEHVSGEVTFSWEWLDDRLLIYASCGTLQNRLENVFRTIIEACARLDAQTVIALGKDALPPEVFGEVPENTILVPYAPQTELLRRADLCILHAGLNTTLDCLEVAVPMIAIPIASEQPGIAMRTFQVDIPLAKTEQQIRKLAEKVWRASRENARGAKTVVLKLKTKEFNSLTRSLTPSAPLSSCDELASIALAYENESNFTPNSSFGSSASDSAIFNLRLSLLFLRTETFR
jgi:UDP:flavonoid glycosyltransferase YjiC (YdhE family)